MKCFSLPIFFIDVENAGVFSQFSYIYDSSLNNQEPKK